MQAINLLLFAIEAVGYLTLVFTTAPGWRWTRRSWFVRRCGKGTSPL